MRMKKSRSGQLSFHSTHFPRSRMEATSASTTKRVVRKGQLLQSRGLTRFAWRANPGEPSIGYPLYDPQRIRRGRPQATLGRQLAGLNARARGQRCHPRASARRAERAAGGAGGRAAVSASARAPGRGCVGSGGSEAAAAAAAAPQSPGDARASSRGSGLLQRRPGVSGPGRESSASRLLSLAPPAASLARSSRRPWRLALTRA